MNTSIINQLDDITANQIAAGEVVERPASVVKELVENSIDAKATKIKVEVEEGGVKLVRVTDNGIGMCREDSVLCLQRHATSKISQSSDLGVIKTLGFRGEALPSIASVSYLKLSTCDNDDNQGVVLNVKGGVISDLEDTALSRGTSIEVCDLFYNTPARLKFLKSKTTEYSHIVSLISEYAICYPNIRFELLKDKKQTLISSPNGNIMNALASVLGLDIAKNLVPFSCEENGIKAHGFISKSDFVRTNRKDEYLFVNGRSVKNRNVLYGAELPFKNLLGPGKYPVCVAFIELDERLVDVNVHPTKSEIKFANERNAFSALYKGVNSAILGGAGIHSIEVKDTVQKTQDNSNSLFNEEKKEINNNTSQNKNYNVVDNQNPLPTKEEIQSFENKIEEKTNTQKSENFVEKPIFDPFDWSSENTRSIEETPVENVFERNVSPVDLSAIKVICQYKNTYIICECVDGIVFIDQHVAHERILYNKMIRRDYSHSYINPLLIPQTINLSSLETALVEDKLEELKQVGYDIAPYGNNTFIIRGVPSEIKEKDTINVFKEIVEELSQISTEKKLTIRPEQVLISASCKQAIKAGKPLTQEEMEYLVRELLKTDNPFTCPHNRPIIVSIADDDLNRKFKRVF